MKLLYIWIEEFRNIRQQEIVVDNEYKISITIPDGDSFGFYDSQGNQIGGAVSSHFRKIFYRNFSYEQNSSYAGQSSDSPIQSVTALVGENASGKSSILECLYRRTNQSDARSENDRYFLLVFLDTARQAIVVRTRDIWLLSFEDKKKDVRNSEGYEEYVFPLSEAAETVSPQSSDTTKLVSIYQNHREKTLYAYEAMGLSTIPINMEYKNFRNSFSGEFDFLCEFPQFGAEGNHIVFYLKDKKSRESRAYFERADLTPDEYKGYFLRKLSQLLFGALRDYLYHQKPEVMADGSLLKLPEEEILRQEDMACAEVLSFCTIKYPHSDGISALKTTLGAIPKAKISAAIAFFRKSTHIYMGESGYHKYLDCVERLFSCLYEIDLQYFTALYKLSLPVETEFQNVIKAFDDCIASGDNRHQWADSIIPAFEWFSAGQQQMSLMFSGLYQRLNPEHKDAHAQDLILMLDEPETHMHPEAGRQFIGILNKALAQFRAADLFRSCQVILATHSPFLIQSLDTYPASIALTKNDHGQITISNFRDLQYLHLPRQSSYSFNLVMYHVFDIPTIELHDELYGYIDEQGWLNEYKIGKPTRTYIRLFRDRSTVEEQKVLSEYIRHVIHHPENTHNARFTLAELRQSIEMMQDFISNKI